MNPFERHGIKHLSPSSLRLYREEPAAWVCRYLMRVKDEAGPGAWRGQAVEAAMDHVLKGQPEHAQKAMYIAFEERAQGVADDKTAAERADLPLYFSQARLALEKAGKPTRYQHKIEIEIPGIEVPLMGFADWIWTDYGIDLKTTKRLPSAADPAHIEQVAVYAEATGLPFSLCYVTPKKFAIYPVTSDQVKDAMVRVRRGARAVRALLEKTQSPFDALSLFSPDMATYHWSPEMILAANKFYEGATA